MLLQNISAPAICSRDGPIMNSKAALLVLITFLALGGVLIFVQPIPQWPEYHDFADDRAFLGIPNTHNVLSNLGFLIVGIWGALFVLSPPGRAAAGRLGVVYLVFFVGGDPFPGGGFLFRRGGLKHQPSVP